MTVKAAVLLLLLVVGLGAQYVYLVTRMDRLAVSQQRLSVSQQQFAETQTRWSNTQIYKDLVRDNTLFFDDESTRRALENALNDEAAIADFCVEYVVVPAIVCRTSDPDSTQLFVLDQNNASYLKWKIEAALTGCSDGKLSVEYTLRCRR